jgi:hypothetical protein
MSPPNEPQGEVSSASPPASRPEWPPIIIRTDLPFWVRLRDLGLAIIGWVVLQDLLFDFWVLMYDWLKYPMFILAPEDTPDWDAILTRLDPFLIAGGAVVAGIAGTALWRRRHIGRRIGSSRPGTPAAATETRASQISTETAAGLHGLKSVDVHIDAAGHISEFKPRPALTNNP